MIRLLSTAALLALVSPGLATPVLADDVTDTLNSAIAAYEQGDIAYALEEIAFATQLLQQMKAGTLNTLLPEPLAGWSRTFDEGEGRALGMMGGTGSVAIYEKDGAQFRIQVVADSPMIAAFSGIFGNAAMMASMGKIERVGREKFLNQDGELTAVIGGRIMVQAMDGDVATMIAHLETMDFRALAAFGS